ncbi:MAG: hypothetical protein JSS32_02410 [Verrucomicrobia bacterium]|nr:hypothetical protein [Verrucomicrobiota bacterium]
MENLIEILEGTPWWVYVLFIYLLNVGIKATRPRGVTIKQIFLIPSFLTIWALYALSLRIDDRYGFLALWASAAACGIYGGVHWARRIHLNVDKVRQVVYLKGSYISLVLILALFAIRYTFGYLYTVRPELMLDPNIFSIDVCLTGFTIGLFLGRSLAIWIRYQKSIE